ncbi:MAG: hypothetical protein GXO37_06460 [Chloroflexi bacterium]|nr:hypothetical protein [Chloroflexota bacterium]
MSDLAVLVAGAGLQGIAAVHFLLARPEVARVWVADPRADALTALQERYPSPKLRPLRADASDAAALAPAWDDPVAVVIGLTPPAVRLALAREAVARGVHYVDASYPLPEFTALGQQAARQGVALLPEAGLDPGLDLVLSRVLLEGLERVRLWRVFGAGIPEPAAATPPLHYKISWTFAGVLAAYRRPARIVQHGRAVDIPADALFRAEHCFRYTVPDLAELEAYPNGDVTRYLARLGLHEVCTAGRYSLRWPGHCALWRAWVELGFLDPEPVTVDGARVAPARFLQALLEPRLRYAPHERDIALVRVEVEGETQGRPVRRAAQILDYRDLDTGLLAMQRTVGFTAAAAALLLATGRVRARGLLSPLQHLPPGPLLEALAPYGIHAQWEGVPGV